MLIEQMNNDRRLVRLETFMLLMVEHLGAGTLTARHQETLAKMATDLVAEFDRFDLTVSPDGH